VESLRQKKQLAPNRYLGAILIAKVFQLAGFALAGGRRLENQALFARF
jgi:hypothetical protein